MRIRSVELVKISPEALVIPKPAHLPKILLFGRSNVGKSSFINYLLQNKKIAKTSSTPGKTQNFIWYKINQSFFFIDAPGYGFAKVPLKIKKEWEKQFSILLEKGELSLIIHLIDIRHPPSELDKKYHKIIEKGNIPYCIIATKADTLSHQKKIRQLASLKKELQKEIFANSIKNKDDTKKIWQELNSFLLASNSLN